MLMILAMLVAVAALACGEDAEDTTEPVAEPQAQSEPTSQPEQPAATTAPAAPAPAPTTAAAVETSATEETEELSGGVFRRLWADPPTLDPHLTTDTTSAGLVVELFSGLVALNTDLQLVPDVAERWEISDDSTCTPSIYATTPSSTTELP